MTQLTVAYMLPDSQRLNWQNAVPLFPQWYRATSWLVPGLTTLPSVLPAEKSYGSHEAANSNMHLQSLHAVCLIAITSSRWYIRYKLPKKMESTPLLKHIVLLSLCTDVTQNDITRISCEAVRCDSFAKLHHCPFKSVSLPSFVLKYWT